MKWKTFQFHFHFIGSHRNDDGNIAVSYRSAGGFECLRVPHTVITEDYQNYFFCDGKLNGTMSRWIYLWIYFKIQNYFLYNFECLKEEFAQFSMKCCFPLFTYTNLTWIEIHSEKSQKISSKLALKERTIPTARKAGECHSAFTWNLLNFQKQIF